MRLTPTTALHYASTATTASNASLGWLQNLKLAQLQHIAQATGIQSSGPKGPLIRRLEREIAQCEAPRADGHGHGPMSILSIDMGIRNLAFAHLVVPSPSPSFSSSLGSSSASSDSKVLNNVKSTSIDRGINRTPKLNAWRRLAISDLKTHSLPLPLPLSGPGSESESESNPPAESTQNQPLIGIGTQPDDAGVPGQETEKENFSPARYAPLAYGLITSLLDRYRPTHVLIERQRFRTGGGSAVQEWTLRVGVFEGMLYAVLVALREGQRYRCRCRSGQDGAGAGEGGGMAPVVVGVEPQRVVRYWGDGGIHGVDIGGLGVDVQGKERGKGKGKGKKSAGMTAREGKKVKIDLVGGWLDRGVASSSSCSPSSPSVSASGGDVPLFGSGCDGVMVGEDPEVRRWVEGYLTRWKGKGTGKKKSKGRKTTDTDTDAEAIETVEIGKLDDLADCLLQGVTWLEWQVMRERLMREGLDALEV